MAEIVLATLNARYIHCAFGLRCLYANLGELQPRARLMEFDINQGTLEIVECILAENPRIVGFGVYIWNVGPTSQIVAVLKRLAPGVTVVLGGPEVSHETDRQPIVALADHVITGEADLECAAVCRTLLGGGSVVGRVIRAEAPDLGRLELPYDAYGEEDIAHRIVYVEASRGCPFGCEFCLSSLDRGIRRFPMPALLRAFERLLDRGVRVFKFVDRTFNVDVDLGRTILRFFHERFREDLFLHFEMIPDRLPEALREWIVQYPPGALQFEIGVQTFNPVVGERIGRRQDPARLEENFRFLRQQTGVHLHADLIAGLPGESLESFAAGFDRLVRLDPHEIQVGILKRLRGAPIVRHDEEWGMVYSPEPPYEILGNRSMDFPILQRLRRFARCWDRVGNSGNFFETKVLIWDGTASPFGAFMDWSEWLHARTGRQHGIALVRLARYLFEYLTVEQGRDAVMVGEALKRDFIRVGREAPPMQSFAPAGGGVAASSPVRSHTRRQRRHRHADPG